MRSVIKLLILFLILALSLALVLTKNTTSELYNEAGKLKATNFDLSFLDTSGRRLFSVTPLNDYYYLDKGKTHLLNKITSVGFGGIKAKAEIILMSGLLNSQAITWIAQGENADGKFSAVYEVETKEQSVEIKRKPQGLDRNWPFGAVINYCEGCFVADDKKRIYFNGELLTEEKIKLAEKIGFTPIILGENQSLPKDSEKILFLDRNGEILFETEANNAEIFLQEQWHLLEFKEWIDRAEHSQRIYFK